MHQQRVIWVLPVVCLTWWMLSRGKAGPLRPSSLAEWHLWGLNRGILCKIEHPFPSSQGTRAWGSSGVSCPLEGKCEHVVRGSLAPGHPLRGWLFPLQTGSSCHRQLREHPALQPRRRRAAHEQPARDGTAPLHLFLPENAPPGRRLPLSTAAWGLWALALLSIAILSN